MSGFTTHLLDVGRSLKSSIAVDSRHTVMSELIPTPVQMSRFCASARLPWTGLFPHSAKSGACTHMKTVVIILLVTFNVALAQEPRVADAMHQDPMLALPDRAVEFSPKLKPLWLAALARDEADLQQKAIDSIARAHRRGMPGLTDTIRPIVEVMASADCHPVVRLAAVKALIVLDAQDTGPLLLDMAGQHGIDVGLLIEPALAQWGYEPARDVWLARLSAKAPLRRRLLLAISGLATVEERRAADPLLQLAMNRDRPTDVRIEAARAVAKLRTDGLQGAAGELATDKTRRGLVDRLVSASMLARHDGKATRALLLQLAVDEEPAIAAIALQRLVEVDPQLIVDMAGRIISSGDANVRRLGAQSLVERPTPATILQLGPMLDDPHPDVRQFVRSSLRKLAEVAEFGAPVREVGTDMLATDRWRGLEQAAILLAGLAHEPAADRLIELLEFERPEVFVTAAWSLRKLAVPETLHAMLDRSVRLTEADHRLKEVGEALPEQVSQIFQAFGEMKFTDSHTLLRRYIPKYSFHEEPRAAAIWALGHLYAGAAPEDLTQQLAERLTDLNPIKPESRIVRRMSGVSLGRMMSKDAMPALREIFEFEFPSYLTGHASAWAIDQITGEGIPEASLPSINATGWFLEPIE